MHSVYVHDSGGGSLCFWCHCSTTTNMSTWLVFPPESGIHSRSYFNWRQDTSSDLQLFAVLSFVLVLFGGLVKGTLIAQVRAAGRSLPESFSVAAVLYIYLANSILPCFLLG